MSNRSRPYITIDQRTQYPITLPWGHQNCQQRGMARQYSINRGNESRRLNQAVHRMSSCEAFLNRTPSASRFYEDRLTQAEDARRALLEAKQSHRKSFKV